MSDATPVRAGEDAGREATLAEARRRAEDEVRQRFESPDGRAFVYEGRPQDSLYGKLVNIIVAAEARTAAAEAEVARLKGEIARLRKRQYAGVVIVREQAAKMCDDAAAYFDRTDGHYDRRQAAGSYRSTAQHIRCITVSRAALTEGAPTDV